MLSQFDRVKRVLSGKMPPKRIFILGVAIVIVTSLTAAYALNLINVNNNVTVNTGVNLKAVVVGPASAPPVCSSQSGTYPDSGLTTSWTLNQGSAQTQYICLQNVGTVNDSLHFTTSPSTLPNGLTISNAFSICNNGSCTSGNNLSPGGFALATIVLTGSASSNPGTTPNAFSITLT